MLRISFADSAFEDDEFIDSVVYNMFTIEQVMVKKIVCVSPSNSIKEVAEILSNSEFHALPVVDQNALVGIVTTTDLIKYLLKKAISNVKVISHFWNPRFRNIFPKL